MTVRRSNTSSILVVIGLVCAAILCIPSMLRAQDKLPPAYPRDGAKKVLDNARVFVWDISWLKQQYPLHRHRYDLVGVYYAPGDRTIVAQDGTRRPVSTKAWDTAFQRAGVTHIEEGASDTPLRALFIDLKEPAASTQTGPAPGKDAFASTAGTPFVDNDRVGGWLLQPGRKASRHVHERDAVVLWFDGAIHGAEFVRRGTTHDSEVHATGDHVYVFELK
jgi:hypothetical protein